MHFFNKNFGKSTLFSTKKTNNFTFFSTKKVKLFDGEVVIYFLLYKRIKFVHLQKIKQNDKYQIITR